MLFVTHLIHIDSGLRKAMWKKGFQKAMIGNHKLLIKRNVKIRF